ncbi:MAG: WG repeat-containing protein, partial [Bacteroidetes bacterium]
MKKIFFIIVALFLVNIATAQKKPDPKKVTPKVDPKKVTPKVDPKKVVTPKVDPKKVDPKAVKKEEPPVIDFPKIVPDPIPTRKGDKWSFTGITATFDNIKPFKPLLRPKKIKVNILDATGKPVQDPKTKKFNQKDSTIIEEYALFAAVKTGEKWGYIDRTGKSLVAPKYYEARSFTNNYAVVSSEQKVKVKVGDTEEEELKILYGVIDDKGVEVVPLKYDNITEVSEDIIDIFDAEKGKMGYFNLKTNKFITDLKYENA